MSTTVNPISDLLGLVDESLLSFTEETRDGINRARLVQGDIAFAKDPQLNTTARYLGGIGLSMEGLSEEIVKKASCVWTSDSQKDYAVFTELEVVVLASSRNRRYYAEVDGVGNRLVCGTNQDGQNAVGWSGKTCHQCPYHPKNFEGKKQDACTAYVSTLVYLPSLDHVCILDLKGGSYMEATDWLAQVGKLSRDFAKQPEMQAKHPGLPRVNSYFFKTTLKASGFIQGKDNNSYQQIEFSKAAAPYSWAELTNTTDVIVKAQTILKDMESAWQKMYVEHNASAVMSLPAAAVAGALPGGTTPAAPAFPGGSKATIAEPEKPAAVPVEPAPPAAPAPTPQPAAADQAPSPPPVTTVPLEEDGDEEVMGF